MEFNLKLAALARSMVIPHRKRLALCKYMLTVIRRKVHEYCGVLYCMNLARDKIEGQSRLPFPDVTSADLALGGSISVKII